VDRVPASGVCELALETLDVDASERFYTEVLGWPVVERWHRSGRAVWVMAGRGTRIGLWEPQIGLGGGRGGVHVHYSVHVDEAGFDGSVARLREHGHDVYEHDHSEYGRGRGRAAYVTDPAGHVLELWTWDVGVHVDELPEMPGSHPPA
jgi:catechol 2,3-dioxygenase-like lactoylglutathione lyase family enzyme